MLGQIIGLLVLFNRFTLDWPGVFSWMGVKWTETLYDGFLLRRLQMEISHGKQSSYKDPTQMGGGAPFQEYTDD
jgi:hypothetical protein